MKYIRYLVAKISIATIHSELKLTANVSFTEERYMVLLKVNGFQKIAIRLLKGLMVIAILSSCLPAEIHNKLLPKEVTILPFIECQVLDNCSAASVTSEAPTFSPPAKAFNASFGLSILAPTATTICYTADSTDPVCLPDATCDPASYDYNAPFTVSNNLTVKAIGCYLNQSDSTIVTAVYTKDILPPGPVSGFTVTQVSPSLSTTLSWTNPFDSDFAGVTIRRQTTGPAALPTDGTGVYSGTNQTFTDIGLANKMSYFYTIFAFDEAGNYSTATTKIAAPNIPAANCAGSECYLFFTDTAYNGNLGGISGADSKCNAAGNKPNGNNYKAVLVDGVNRQACKQSHDCMTNPTTNPGETLIDWVLYPNQAYKRADNISLGTTNASGTFEGNFSTYLSMSVGSFWSGFQSDLKPSPNNCSDWQTSGANGGTGKANSAYNVNSIFANSTSTCSSTLPILCAEQ